MFMKVQAFLSSPLKMKRPVLGIPVSPSGSTMPTVGMEKHWHLHPSQFKVNQMAAVSLQQEPKEAVSVHRVGCVLCTVWMAGIRGTLGMLSE